ncbi:MAG: hypothetical protein ACYC58_09155 [Pseudomonadaceae bacterium]
MVEIVIFEDNTTAHSEDICKELPDIVNIYGKDYTLKWHEKWNALGDHADTLGICCEKITSQESYNEALAWCLDYKGPGICFFDYQLLGTSVTTEHITQLQDCAFAISRANNTTDAARFFNSEAQGLLLAIALATNTLADVDIWLATSLGVGVDTHIATLNLYSTKGKSIRKTDSVGKPPSQPRAIETITSAINDFVTSRTFSDPGFWPDYADSWFLGNNLYVPHNHNAYSNLEASNKEPLINYLVSQGLQRGTAIKWLAQPNFYDSLKRFIGRYALAHTGARPLTLNCILFPLIKASSENGWADDFMWDSLNDPIIPQDKTRSRQFIILLFALFKTLSNPRRGESPTHKVYVAYSKKADGTHLLVDFSFDCSVGDSKSLPSFISKCLFFPWIKPDGDTSEALWDVLQLSHSPTATRSVFISIYPVQINGEEFTRFDFKAKTD